MLDAMKRRAICNAIARIMREERELRGLTLSAVAAKAGISYQMVGMVEKQARNPTIDTLLRMCGALEIDLEKVIRRAKAEAAEG